MELGITIVPLARLKAFFPILVRLEGRTGSAGLPAADM